MKKAFAGVLHHSFTSSNNENPEKRHHYCTNTAESWCNILGQIKLKFVLKNPSHH